MDNQNNSLENRVNLKSLKIKQFIFDGLMAALLCAGTYRMVHGIASNDMREANHGFMNITTGLSYYVGKNIGYNKAKKEFGED